MPRPKLLFPKFLPCLWLFAVAAPAPQARTYFAQRQVLGPELDLDVLVWMHPGDPALAAAQFPAPDSAAVPAGGLDSGGVSAGASAATSDPRTAASGGWDCARAGSGFRISSCYVKPFVRNQQLKEQYLYWAFLNLDPHSKPTALAAREHEQTVLDGLPRPLAVFRKQKDSCQYMVFHSDAYVPVAAGQLSCPDLASALAGLAKDLAGRTQRVRGEPVSREEKQYAGSSVPRVDLTPAFDFGLEGAVILPIMLSGDTEMEEQFDLDDMAEHSGAPFSGRLFILYRKLVGLRLGYEYADMGLTSEFLSFLQSGVPTDTAVLNDWRIGRHTFTGELMIGRGFRGPGLDVYMGGLAGIGKTIYSETATVNGEEGDVSGLLKDVTGLRLGGQIQFRFLSMLHLGLESGFDFKGFKLKNATRQPDGIGAEFQMRLALGFYQRFKPASAAF